MTELSTAESPSLLELSAEYQAIARGGYDRGFGNIKTRDTETALKAFHFIAQTYPYDVIKIALTLGKYVPFIDWMGEIIVPYVNNIADSDVATLRHATAYMVSNAIEIEKNSCVEPQVIQALAQSFKKLSRIPGQADEVRALADDFYSKCLKANGTENMDFNIRFASIYQFTTAGMMAAKTLVPAGLDKK